MSNSAPVAVRAIGMGSLGVIAAGGSPGAAVARKAGRAQRGP